MTPLQSLIDLVALTGYTVEAVRSKEPMLTEEVDLPIIYVGYSGINSTNPSFTLDSNFIDMHGEKQIETFETQIVALPEDLSIVWNKLFETIIGKHVVGGEEDRSGITHSQGGIVGIENGRYWWIDRWNMAFPTLNVYLNG